MIVIILSSINYQIDKFLKLIKPIVESIESGEIS